MKYYIIPYICLLFSAGLKAQSRALPYTTGFETAPQRAGWQSVRTGLNHISNWDFSTTLAGHDYPVGGSTDTVSDWLMSPPLKITHGARLSFRYNVYAIIGSTTPSDQFSIWLGRNTANPANGTFVKFLDLTDSASSSNNWHDTGDIELPFTTDTGYIAFRYRATDNWFTVALDDIAVVDPHAGIFPRPFSRPVRVFPNPANTIIDLSSREPLSHVKVFSSDGRMVYSDVVDSDVYSIDISSWQQGIYLLEATHAKGTQFIKVIKQ